MFYMLLALLVCPYVVFPFVMALLVPFERKRRVPYEPHVAVLIPARNEVACIAQKIRNTLASDYPVEKTRIVVASDGSIDGTDEEVAIFTDRGVQLIRLEDGLGKAEAVNRMAEAVDAEILVFTDADVLIDASALRLMAQHFADDKVGAVCSRRVVSVRTGAASAWAERIHRYYESLIKRGEGVLGRVIGADGALYAVRRDCFMRVPSNVPDDFVAVLRVLKSGMKVTYEAAAVASEEPSSTRQGEALARRRRTVARAMRGVWQERGLLNPIRFPLCSLLLFSHKVCRWFGGVILGGLLISNMLLLSDPFFRWCLVVQVSCYSLACLGYLAQGRRVGRVLVLFRYFALSNLGAALGVFDALSGRDWATWRPQRRD